MSSTAQAGARPDVPPCPRCGATHVRRAGCTRDGRQKYRCPACGRQFREPRPGTEPRPPCPPCPHCGGRCQRRGKGRRNCNQVYWCRDCGRYNTEGMRWPRPEGGPFPYRVALCLGVLAARALDRYCQATGLAPRDAVRQVFRRAAQPLIMDSARRVHEPDGSVRTVIIRPPARPYTPSPLVQRPLPDVRSQVTRARNRDPATFRRCSVYVDWRLTVCPGARTKEGLLRTAQARQCTHQEAARYLIENVPPPRRHVA